MLPNKWKWAAAVTAATTTPTRQSQWATRHEKNTGKNVQQNCSNEKLIRRAYLLAVKLAKAERRTASGTSCSIRRSLARHGRQCGSRVPNESPNWSGPCHSRVGHNQYSILFSPFPSKYEANQQPIHLNRKTDANAADRSVPGEFIHLFGAFRRITPCESVHAIDH